MGALLTYERAQKVLTGDNEVFISVVAPAVGAMAGIVIVIISDYRKRRNKLRSPAIIPVTGNSTEKKPNFFRKNFHRVVRNRGTRFVVSAFKKVASINALRIAASSSSKIIDIIIIGRTIILIKDTALYYVDTRENLIRVAANTLLWIVYSKERDKLVSLSFLVVTLLTAKLWAASPKSRRFIKIWVCITLLNLCGSIYVNYGVLDPKFANIRAFGLPVVERPIHQLNTFTENATNSKVSMLGKEDKLINSLPLQNEIEILKGISKDVELETNKTIQNEIPKGISKDVVLETNKIIQNEMPKGMPNDIELETNKIIQNSILIKESSTLSKKEELQKGKTSKTRFTSKSRRRTNNLQNLNKTTSNTQSLPIENEVENNGENFFNSTKIKAEKVR